MKKTSTLNLTQIKICPFGSAHDMKTEFAIKRQSPRHAFLIAPYTDKIAVEMTFAKDDLDNSNSGLRQLISVIFLDTDNGTNSKISFYAYLPKGTTHKTYLKVFDFNYFETNTAHNHSVIVINETENRQMGNYSIQLNDTQHLPEGINKHIKMEYARCVSYDEDNNYEHYLSFNPNTKPFSHIGFWGSTTLETHDHDLLNEFEVKIHFPNGQIQSYIKAPIFYDNDVKGSYKFRVLEDFIFREHGIYYAELLLMGQPISGFIFRVSDLNTVGEWKDYDSNLNPIIGYTTQTGEKTFLHAFDSIFFSQENNKNNEKDSAPIQGQLEIEWDDEEFGNLLDEVLNQKSEEENEDCDLDTTLNEDDDNDDNDDDEDDNNEQPPTSSNKGSSWENLDELTGLKSVKEKLHSYKKIIDFAKLRTLNGLPTFNIPLHAMFLGSPGTGKTTVAKALGQMLADAGLLSKGHVVVRERSSLLGRYYSSECENTLEALEEARGGILFIDEAYQLLDEHDPRDPGRHVIDTLLTKLSDEKDRDWMLILAGYPQQTQRLYEINPGLKSRIPESNIYTFDDFNESELMEIAESYLAKNDYTLSNEARQALLLRLNADYLSRNESFGNARHVMNLIQTNIIPAMATRIIDTHTTNDLTTILASDIPEPINNETNSRRRIGFC